MPPLPLTTLLQTALPELSTRTRAILSTLGCYNGDVPAAGEVATLIGMRSRFQLARTLRQEGLPPFEELAGWARVLYWLFEAEGTGVSLHRLARRARLDAASAYRLVRRVTRMRWSELRRMGIAAAVERLRERCHGRPVSRCACSRPPAPARRAPRVRTPEATSRRCAPSSPHHPAGTLVPGLLVNGAPFDVAIGPDGTAYVTCVRAARLERVALEPFRSIGRVSTGPVPTRIVFNAAGTFAYVTNQFAEEVGVIDVERGEQVASIDVPGHPLGAVLAPDNRTLFVATNLDRLHAISLHSGRMRSSVSVPQVCTEIALDASGHRLFLPTWNAGRILEFETSTLQVMRRFDVGGKVQGVALPSDGRTLFAANEDGWLDVIQLSSGVRTRLQFGTTTFGVRVSPDDALVYVTLLGAGQVVVLDRWTLQVVTTLHPGGQPRRVDFDSSGRFALIANEAGWVDLVR
ncbi:MAG TPA: YncE family protein [Gemmatimonadales bacterium]|nr:YncE family protein [Gemmatimonadales bacterium]